MKILPGDNFLIDVLHTVDIQRNELLLNNIEGVHTAHTPKHTSYLAGN